jgi:3-methyladenine DNA glycosylase/8-oxoguanine DNA glycosylase
VTRIEVPPDFDFAWLLSFLRARAIPGVECVDDESYLRVLRVDGDKVTIRLTAGWKRGSLMRLRIATDTPVAQRALHAHLARMLDLDTDLGAFRALAARDTVLAPLVAVRPGIRLIRFPDPFEGLVRGILGQQVSLAAAATTAARLARCVTGHAHVAANGPPAAARRRPIARERVPTVPALLPFPTAADLAAAGEARIRAIGLTRVKAAALLAAARAVADGNLDFSRVAAEGPAAADAALTSLPGVGPWTAAYVRMRGLGDPDAFPASDLGVLKALGRLLRRDRVDPQEATRIAERWRPWRAYATLHLWHSLSRSTTV